jgi:hypothetical protein
MPSIKTTGNIISMTALEYFQTIQDMHYAQAQGQVYEGPFSLEYLRNIGDIIKAADKAGYIIFLPIDENEPIVLRKQGA